MRITWNELTVGFDPSKSKALLDDWRWLIGDAAQLVVVSAIGDLFLRDTEGRILWLDVGSARVTQAAESADEFERLMQQTDHADEWFVPVALGRIFGRQLWLVYTPQEIMQTINESYNRCEGGRK